MSATSSPRRPGALRAGLLLACVSAAGCRSDLLPAPADDLRADARVDAAPYDLRADAAIGGDLAERCPGPVCREPGCRERVCDSVDSGCEVLSMGARVTTPFPLQADPQAPPGVRDDGVVRDDCGGLTIAPGRSGATWSWVQLSQADCGAFVDPNNWRALAWDADVPPGAHLTVRYRVGDTAVPDAGWTAFSELVGWSPVWLIAGATRYIQIEFRFASSDAGAAPRLHRWFVGWSWTGLPC